MADEKMNPAPKSTDTAEVASINPDDKNRMQLNEDSQVATEIEHSLGVIEACKLYPKAIFWAGFFAWSLVMVGYDSGIIFSLYALPAFTQKYGTYYGPEIGWEVSAAWQTALGMGTPVGQVLGALLASYPMERFGRKPVFAAALSLTTAFIFLQMFAPDIHTLCAGEFLAGLLYGVYIVLAPTYASEVCPVVLRGNLNAGMNLAFVIGQFIASGVGKGISERTDQWAYRIPFSVQWAWPPILLFGLIFCPESPWWLVRKGRINDAERSLRRLAVDSPKVDIKATLAMIQTTDLHEREIEQGATYLECIKGSNRIRTEIALVVQIFQIITGISLIGYATYFFELAGLPTDKAFDMGVGNTAIGFVATCCSWILMSYVGRRKIYMFGLAGMSISLLVIGIIDCAPNYSSRPALSWAQAALLDILTFAYQGTIGPVCFVIFAEIGATRLRSQTVAIAAGLGSIFQIATAVGVPYMLNASAANWRGKAGFLFGGIAAISVVWCYFRLPETKGRTYQELDIMFEDKVPPRKFKNFQITSVEGV